MTNIAAGVLDRRVTIEEATETRDAAGDVIATWGVPAGWPSDGRRWAKKSGVRLGETPMRGVEVAGQAQQVLREADTIFVVRQDRFTLAIAPETFRVFHHGRTYLIVAISPTNDRDDALILLCSSRPDLRGSSAPVIESGQQ